MGNEQGVPLTLLEDTTPGAFDREIRIYYNDADCDPNVNDDPDESLCAGDLDWEIFPFYGEDSRVEFITVGDAGTDINEENEFYYYQWNLI